MKSVNSRGGAGVKWLAPLSYMLSIRLFQIEVARIARRWPFWIGVVGLAIVGSSNIVLGGSSEQRLFGAFSTSAISDNLVLLISVFVGGVVAGSLAADRRRRYPTLVLTRGISRLQYLLTKAAAMAVVSGGGVFLSCALMFTMVATLLPLTGIAGGGAGGTGGSGPYPGLLATHPLLNDVVLVMLLSVGAAALALSGLVFGAVVANEFMAAAVPFALLIGGIFVFRTDALLFLGPYTQLELTTSYPYSLPQWAWSFTAPVYWSVFAFLCVAASAAIFLKKEEI